VTVDVAPAPTRTEPAESTSSTTDPAAADTYTEVAVPNTNGGTIDGITTANAMTAGANVDPYSKVGVGMVTATTIAAGVVVVDVPPVAAAAGMATANAMTAGVVVFDA
jgi:hypothetical protein